MRKLFLSLLTVFTAVTVNLKAQTQNYVFWDGFESGNLSQWTQENALNPKAAPAAYWAVEDTTEHLSYPATVLQGKGRAYLRNNTGETQGYATRLVSPEMDISLDKVYRPIMVFWYANPKWTSDRDTLRVLYKTGPNAQWKKLAEYSNAKANWEKVQLELPEPNGTYQIAFEGKDNLGRGIVLDSVVVRSTPICTDPHDLMVTNLGAGKINLAWQASWDANEFEVVISKNVIDPDSIANIPAEDLAYHDSVSGLQQNCDIELVSGEYYYAYVRSLCDEDNSFWNAPFRFRVKATKNVPYFYGFDMPYEAGTVRRDLEWTWGNNTGHFNPFINVFTELKDRGKYSKSETSCLVFTGANNLTTPVPANKYAYVATPALSDTAKADFSLNQCVVRFWTTLYNFQSRKYARSIIVGAMTDPEDITTFVPVDTISMWGYATFQENVVDFSGYNGGGNYVAFVSNFDEPNVIYVDDMTVEYKSATQVPTEISVNPGSTKATITWKGNATSYNVLITNREVDPTNPAADFVVAQTTVNANSYATEALEADHSWNRPYFVYVQAVDGAKVSDWSYRYPFVTIAEKKAVPYSFEFEQVSGKTYTIGDDATQYPTEIGIFSNDPEYPHLVTTTAHGGSSALQLTKDWGNDSWITLPPVESLSGLQVTFYLSGSSTPTQASAIIGVMTNPMDINTFIPVSECKVASAGYSPAYANFSNYTGPEGVIAIVWKDVDGEKQTVNYIDDITVDSIAKCLPPVNLQTEAQSDSVTVRWDKSDASTWEFILTQKQISNNQFEKMTFDSIARTLEGVIFADTLTWNDPLTVPTFGFDSLTYNTSYYIYVRTMCGEDKTWWVSSSFKTPCPDNFPIPFSENFESYSTGAYEDGFNCWQAANYGTGTGYPKILKPTSGAQDGNMLELWSTSTTQRNLVMLPGLDADMTKVVLSFDARSYSTTTKTVVYVGSMGDIADWTTFVAIDTFYMGGGNEFTKVRLDLANYKLAYNNIVFTSGLGDNLEMNSDIYIDNISIKPNTCIEAWNVEATDIQTNAIDIKWDGKATGDEWKVKVMQDTVLVIADTTVIGKAFHAAGLEPVKAYTFYIQPSCDTIWTDATYRTACVKLDPTKPNKEDFEGITTGTSYNAAYQIPCWTVGNANPSASTSYIPFVYKSATYASSGTNTYRAYGYSTTSSPAYIATPEIDIENMKDLAVTFNMYATTSYWWICGVMSDPTDLSTFVALDSVKGTGASVQYTYDLSEYADKIPATAKYFAWRGRYGVTDYLYLDDVSIIKVTCPLPKPSYSGLTAEQVRISSGLRGDNDWILLVVDTAAFSADKLALLDVDSLVHNDSIWKAHVIYYDTVDVRSKLVTGLREQTDFYAAIATVCEDGISAWQSLTFKTPCQAITPEAMGTITFAKEDGYVTGSAATRYLPCWTTGNKSGNAGPTSSYIPYVTAGSATSAYSRNGLNYLYIYSYVPSSATGTAYDGAYAIMPEVDVTDISKYQVNFWARTTSSTTAAYREEMIVGIVTDPTDLNTFVAVDTVKLSHTAYEPFTVSLEDYEGDYLGNKGRYIMLMTETGSTPGTLAYGYAYVSEISVEAIPTCRPVTEFTVDSIAEDAAMISWKQYSDSYRMMMADKEVAEDKKATYEWLLDSVVTKTDSVLITGLNPATQYYVYAQALCDGGDSSAISMAYAGFTTNCPEQNGYPVPYYNDFEDGPSGSGKKPLCWDGVYLTMDTVGTTQTYPYVYTTASYAASKPNSVYMYSYGYWNNTDKKYTSNTKAIAVAPKVAGDLNEYMISFYARKGGTTASYGSMLRVGYVTDATQHGMDSTFVEITKVEVTTATQQPYQVIISDYTNSIPAGARIALKADWSASDYATPTANASYYGTMYIDNFKIGMPPSCFAPTLEPGNTSLSTADINIIPAKAWNDKWQIAVVPDSVYSKADYDAAEWLAGKDVRIVNADSANFVVSGLDHSTLYWFYGRTVCGGDDGNSNWTDLAVSARTKYYYGDSYFFGFEQEEGWERSPLSTSDSYIIHPALEAGYVQLGSAITSYSYMPYAYVTTSSGYNYGYGPSDWSMGKTGIRWNATSSYYGQYVIMPALNDAKDRSFEFQFRNGYSYISSGKYIVTTSYDVSIEVGTVDKFKGMETYQKLATISRPALPSNTEATEANDWQWWSYTLDLDSATIADKQIVFYQAEKPKESNYPYFDNVKMGAPKGFGLVSLDKVLVEATEAIVSWENLGGPWNLYITHYNEKTKKNDTIASYLNIDQAIQQTVTGLTPQTKYTVSLVAANAPKGTKYHVSDSRDFRTPCLPMEADAKGEYFWDFDDPNEVEPNDILAGAATDTAYLKPTCFTTATNYTGSYSNGYQWLWQSKGHDYYSTLGNVSATYLHREIGYGDSFGSLRVYTTSTYTSETVKTWIALPELHCDLDTMMIEFWGRCLANNDETASSNPGQVISTTYLGASYSKSLVIGTLTDPSDFSTLEVIDTITYAAPAGISTSTKVSSDPTGNRYWQKFQLPLAGAHGKYIVLFQPAYGLFFVDNLKVKPVGNTLFAPSGASTSDVTANSATFNWEAKHPAIQTIVVVTDQDGKKEILRDTIPGSQMTFTVDTLKPATSYQWYVYQTNGSVNTLSTGNKQFYTECVEVEPNYATGFELDEGWKLVPGATSDTYKQTLCWVYGNAGTTTAWSSSFPYNYANSTSLYAHSGAYAAKLYAYSTTLQTYLAMPAIEDVAAYDTLQVNFWIRPAYASQSTSKISTQYTVGSTASTKDYYYSKAVIVGTMTDPNDATTFVPIDTINYNGTLATTDVVNEANDYLFQPKKVALAGAKGRYVAFMATLYAKGETRKSTYDHIWIDDVSLSPVQRCEAPEELTSSEISAHSAKLIWGAMEGAERYILQVSTDYTYTVDSAFVFNDTVNAASQVVEGLNAYTDYVWRVRTLCGVDLGESEFSQNATFTTAREPFFVETFGAANLDADWSFATNPAALVIDSTDVELTGANSTSYGWRRVTNNAGIEGAHYAVVFYSSSSATTTDYDYYWMISPVITLSDKADAHLSFDIALTGCSAASTPGATQVTEAQMADDYSFAVAVSEDGGKTWMKDNILGVWNNQLPSGMQLRDIPFAPTTMRFDLAKYAGKNIRIAFYREADTYKGSSPYSCAVHLDNIRVNYYDKIEDSVTSCQYEDVDMLGFYIDGDKAPAGEIVKKRIEYAYDFDANTKHYRDSMYVLNVNYVEVPFTTYKDTICEGDTYTDNNFLVGKTETGLYQRKLQGQYCDSIVQLSLYVRPKVYYSFEKAICQGGSYNFNGKELNRTGVYVDTLKNAYGCDSIVELSLSVVDAFTSEFNAAICAGTPYYWEAVGKSYNEPGDYTETLQTADGCDSIVTLHLSHNKVYNETTAVTICEGKTYKFGDKELSVPGEYTYTFESVLGCDSTVTLTLTISDMYRDSVKVTITEGETYNFYGQEYSVEGEYDVYRPGQNGDCDSLRVLVITVNPIEAINNVSGNELRLRPTILNAGEKVHADYNFTAADLADLKVEVYDIVGRSVEARMYSQEPIIIDAFPIAGVYTVRITSGTGLNLVGRVVVR